MTVRIIEKSTGRCVRVFKKMSARGLRGLENQMNHDQYRLEVKP